MTVTYTMMIVVDDSTARGIMARHTVTNELAKLAKLSLNDACRVELFEGDRPLVVDNRWVG